MARQPMPYSQKSQEQAVTVNQMLAEGRSRREIAEHFAVTRERVRQIVWKINRYKQRNRWDDALGFLEEESS